MHPKEFAMRIRYRQPSDHAQHATAVDVFTRDGGHLPAASNQPFRTPTGAERVSMAALGIQFDGHAFRFSGYRYSRLADAVTDAVRASADRSAADTSTWTLR
jgi:hypothetical protein